MKFSYQSLLGILKKSVHIFFPVSPQDSVPCADLYGCVSNWDFKLWRPFPRLYGSARPPYLTPFHSRLTLSVDCIPIAWSCTSWYHNFPNKYVYLSQHHLMFSFYSFSYHFQPKSFPNLKLHYGVRWWLNELFMEFLALFLAYRVNIWQMVSAVIMINLWNGHFTYLA